MYRRVLLIGLGGSGGKTLRFLKRDLVDWLESKGWKDGIPEGWQFLHIDSPTQEDGLVAGGTPLDKKEYVGLVARGTRLEALVGQLDSIPSVIPELAGWRVEPSTAPRVPLEAGCGQYRALGRTVGLAFADAVRQGLDQAIERMNRVDVTPELQRLYQHVHDSDESGASVGPPIPIIVSSLAGGTGAGLLLDVVDILHSMEDSWAELSMGLYYTSDVFPAHAGNGVHPNGLAAISEVLNGSWWGATGAADARSSTSEIPAKTPRILRSRTGLEEVLKRTGTHCNFLIGGTNARGSRIGEGDQVFEMVGGALLSWVTDPVVQEDFVSYTTTNWSSWAAQTLESNVDALVNRGEAGEAGLPAFSALGFARVSVGTKYLRRYAAQRLANDVALHLGEAHVLGARAQQVMASQGLAPGDTVVAALVQDAYPVFRRSVDVAGISGSQTVGEFSIDRNVEESLTPPALRDWVREQQQFVLSRVRDEPPADGETWVERLLPVIRLVQKEIDRRVEEELPRITQAWVDAASKGFPSVVESTVAEHGLRVATGLVEALAGEFNSRVAGARAALAKRTEEYESWASRSNVEQAMRKELRDVLEKGKVDADGEFVEAAIEKGVAYAVCSARALISARAELLTERFAADFLRPLAQALREGLDELNGSASDRSEWPEWSSGLPPKSLEPPKSEYTVIEKEDFAAIFDGLLQDSFDDGSVEVARRRAVSEIGGGLAVRSAIEPLRRGAPDWNALEPLQFIHTTQPWLAGYELSGDAVASRAAMFSVRADSSDVLARADHWLMRKDHSFERLLSVDLRSYTRSPDGARDDSTEYVDRQNRVMSKLQAALNAAAPLVEINDSLARTAHPDLEEFGSIFRNQVSSMPFRGHPLEGRVRDLLMATAYTGREGDFEKIFTNEAELPYIDVISMLRKPVSAVVIDSLLSPIAKEWSKASLSVQTKTEFWRLRRTRALREFIPVPQRHIRCMIRGWFTARMLGLVDTTKLPYRIVLDPDGVNPRAVSFPANLLTPPGSSAKDQLPVLLESLPLALIDVNRLESYGPLEPYVALRNLGMSDPAAPGILAYPAPNPVLDGWIASGVVAGAEASPGFGAVHRALTGVPDDPEARRTAFIELAKATRQSYVDGLAAYGDKVQGSKRTMSGPPHWIGISDEIGVALSAMIDALEGQASEDGDL